MKAFLKELVEEIFKRKCRRNDEEVHKRNIEKPNKFPNELSKKFRKKMAKEMAWEFIKELPRETVNVKAEENV